MDVSPPMASGLVEEMTVVVGKQWFRCKLYIPGADNLRYLWVKSRQLTPDAAALCSPTNCPSKVIPYP